MSLKSSLRAQTGAVAVSLLGLVASGASANGDCDPTFVIQSGTMMSVKPTGSDDTANLQCALDTAVMVGPSMRIQLQSGTFYTEQLVATGFRGTLAGEGAAKTIVTNLPGLTVAHDWTAQPPSASNRWPSLLAFVDGDFTLTDLAIHVRGDAPTSGWFNHGYSFSELGHGVVVLGTEAHARFDRVLVEGEPAQATHYGTNLLNAVFYEGYGGASPPLAGTFRVTRSTIRCAADGAPVNNLKSANVLIANNTFEQMFFGASAAHLIDTRYEFSNNHVSGIYGAYGYNQDYSNVLENVGSTLVFRNNVVRAYVGILLDPIFGDGMNCLLAGNNFVTTEAVGIVLGSDTFGCTVVGGKSKTNVFDVGVGNVLVGVNNMGTGIGPRLQIKKVQ